MLNSSQIFPNLHSGGSSRPATDVYRDLGRDGGDPGGELGENIREESNTPHAIDPFICVSSALRRLLVQARVTASRLQFGTLEGESGTGKHLFAQTLHSCSSLSNLPFRRCDAREWLANDADISALTGTLYLDRIDLLAPAGQGLLLNLIKTLHDNPSKKFLLLVSAQAPVRQLAAQGLLLADLAFRLSAVCFFMPPLRDHREDIGPIAQALVDRICRRYQQPIAVLGAGTLPRLLQYKWPGNVRELASVLEAAILSSNTGVIRPADLPLLPSGEASLTLAQENHPSPQDRSSNAYANEADGSLNGAAGNDLSLDAAVLRHIQFVLDLNRGNKLRSARQLGISRSTLYRLLGGEPLTSEPHTTA